MLCIIGLMLVVLFVGSTSVGFQTLLDVRLLPHNTTCRPLVFGIGLPRTGTCSLSAALVVLGRKVQHFPYKFQEHSALYTRVKDAFVDVTIMGIRPSCLLAAYPNALMIYTIRENASWVRGMQKLHTMLLSYGRMFPVAKTISNRFIRTFGSTPDEWLVYKQSYEQEVYTLRRDYPRQIVCIDILDTGNQQSLWHKVSVFIQAGHIPTCPFPRRSELEYHLTQFWSNVASIHSIQGSR